MILLVIKSTFPNIVVSTGIFVLCNTSNVLTQEEKTFKTNERIRLWIVSGFKTNTYLLTTQVKLNQFQSH